MYRTDFWTLWEKARVECFKRTASKHVYYLGWNRSPAQVGCMGQVLGAGALGRPRGIGWGGRWEGGLGWGIHVNPWLIHVNVWQKPLQYCKVISLQLIKINEIWKKKIGTWFTGLARSFIRLFRCYGKLHMNFLANPVYFKWIIWIYASRISEEPEVKLSTPLESSKKQESSWKTSTSALLTTPPKPLTV